MGWRHVPGAGWLGLSLGPSVGAAVWLDAEQGRTAGRGLGAQGT